MAIQSSTQPSVRARTRTRENPAPSAANMQPGATDDWMNAGAAALNTHAKHKEVVAARREERAIQNLVPYRFWLGKGEESDVVILDNDFGPSVFEHDLTFDTRFGRKGQNGRNQDLFVISPCQWETDPITQETGREPYHCTYLTVKDLRSGVNSQGEPYANRYKLLPLKGDVMDMMVMIREQQIKAGHTQNPLRGVQLLMKRGTGDTSPRTGLPMFLERHSEADIMAAFQHPEVKSEKDGHVIKVANAECFPCDYRAIFPKPSAEEIRRRFGIENSGTTGSQRANEQAWGSSGGGQQGWDNGGQGGEQQASSGGIRSRAGQGAGAGQTAAEVLEDDDIPF